MNENTNNSNEEYNWSECKEGRGGGGVDREDEQTARVWFGMRALGLCTWLSRPPSRSVVHTVVVLISCNHLTHITRTPLQPTPRPSPAGGGTVRVFITTSMGVSTGEMNATISTDIFVLRHHRWWQVFRNVNCSPAGLVEQWLQCPTAATVPTIYEENACQPPSDVCVGSPFTRATHTKNRGASTVSSFVLLSIASRQTMLPRSFPNDLFTYLLIILCRWPLAIRTTNHPKEKKNNNTDTTDIINVKIAPRHSTALTSYLSAPDRWRNEEKRNRTASTLDNFQNQTRSFSRSK